MKLVARTLLEKLLTPEQLASYKEAHKAANAARLMVLEAFNKSPEGSVINKSGQVPETTITDSMLIVTYKPLFNAVELSVEDINEFDKAGKLPGPYVPESVLNTMLHSKLLTDDEKKQVLREQGYLK